MLALLHYFSRCQTLEKYGTITINGLVTDKTCDIVTPAGKDFTVTLPTVSKQTLAVAGDVAGRTPFQINLANCSQGKVATYFEP
ncbi:ferrous iron transporter B, partial [Acinetobacter baumannii]